MVRVARHSKSAAAFGGALLTSLLLALGVGNANAGSQPQPCAVDITVSSAAGGAIAGADVHLRDPGRFDAHQATDAKGHAHFAATSCDPLRVRVRARGFLDANARLAAGTPGRSRAMTLRLSPRAKVATAKARKAKAEEKVRVQVYGMGMGAVGGGGVAHGYGGLSYKAAPAPRPRPSVDVDRSAEPTSREGYAADAEEPFCKVADRPMSTFSIDVDTASWSNARRYIERQHRLPPSESVRIEEFVNAFPYEWPGPKDDHPFAIHTELSVAPWNPEHQLMAIAVQGRRVENKHLPPANLVFLLDVSGSMNSPDKLPLLKSSLSLLVREMRPVDRVSIVVYAGAAGLVLPPTSGADQRTILDAMDRLQAGGSTAGGAGIALAYEVARKSFVKGGNNRVILCTDGDFNVGQSSDGALVQQIEQERKSGVFLTVLGFGTGNYQDAKMQQLAQHGNGNHAYIDSILEARRVLVEQMGGTLLTIAKDVKIQVEPNPAKVAGYRLIGYDNRRLKTEDFANDKKDAGELGAGHTVTALYEIIPRGAEEKLPAAAARKYTEVRPTAAASSDELATVRLRYKTPKGSTSQLLERPVQDAVVALGKTSDDFRFATAVAEFGLLLRESQFKAKASFRAAIARAEAAYGEDVGGHRRAFVQLAKQAALLRQAASR